MRELTESEIWGLRYAYEWDKLSFAQDESLDQSGEIDLDRQHSLEYIRGLADRLIEENRKPKEMRIENGMLVLDGVKYSKDTLLENLK